MGARASFMTKYSKIGVCEKGDHDAYMLKIRPNYYVDDVVINEADIELGKRSWNMVMSAQATDPFKERLADKSKEFNYSSSLSWFYEEFYGHFFELCPETKVMFKHVSMVKQGRLIAGLITSCLEALTDPIKLRDRLQRNTRQHNGKGIKSEHYIKMGEALIYALSLVLGPPFDAPTKLAWERIYSYMLSIILPISVEYEVNEIQLEKSKSKRSQNSTKSSVEWSFHRLDWFLPKSPTSLYTSPMTARDDRAALLSPKRMSQPNDTDPQTIVSPKNHESHPIGNARGSILCVCEEEEEGCPSSPEKPANLETGHSKGKGKCPF